MFFFSNVIINLLGLFYIKQADGIPLWIRSQPVVVMEEYINLKLLVKVLYDNISLSKLYHSFSILHIDLIMQKFF